MKLPGFNGNTNSRYSAGESLDPKTGKSLRSLDDEIDARGKSSVSEDAKSAAEFEGRRPNHRLPEVQLNRDTRKELNVLLSRIAYHDVLYGDWGLDTVDPKGRHIVVNFYGPPGTGKTMCAEALASELKKTIIDVSYAEIESKYVGETGKKIKSAFKCAAEQSAVLFFDEADSILGRRMTSVTQAADHGVNVSRAVMLKELDSFEGVVVFATNLARNYDQAFVRRILQHIHVPLPDVETRVRIWQQMVPQKAPGRSNLDWNRLAQDSDGLAGGDILNCVRVALTDAVQETRTRGPVQVCHFAAAIERTRRAKRDVGPFDTQLISTSGVAAGS